MHSFHHISDIIALLSAPRAGSKFGSNDTTVPFNSLTIKMRSHTKLRFQCGSGGNLHQHNGASHQQENLRENFDDPWCYENVFSKLKLKHLSLCWDMCTESLGDCWVSLLLFRFLTEKSDELISLSLT